MFADFPLRKYSEPHCQRSQFFRYKAKPDFVITLTKNRLDPEPARTPPPCLEPVRFFRGTHKIRGTTTTSTEKFRILPISKAPGLVSSETKTPDDESFNSFGVPDDVFHVDSWRMISVCPGHDPFSDCANFFHGLLRPKIVLSDQEHHSFNKPERVRQQ